MEIKNSLNNYQTLKVIGKGTYGTILLCRNNKYDTLSVLKEVNISSAGESQYRETENEIKVLSKLNHPHVIKFYESFFHNNCVYISMEYASYGNLAEYMHARHHYYLPSSEILYIFCQILFGVQHIHEQNIIHRDIKAENIFLSEDHGGIVKIGDFGISKILGKDKTSSVIGTPYYLAPELCANNPYDTKTDIWALGCLLYEMCTHKRAFEATTLIGLIQKITSGAYEPLNKHIYENSMQEVIDSMLTVIPEERCNASELLKKPYLFPMLCTLHSFLTHLYSYN